MKNTTLILQQLRLLMLNASIVGPDYLSAYIVPSSDGHHVSLMETPDFLNFEYGHKFWFLRSHFLIVTFIVSTRTYDERIAIKDLDSCQDLMVLPVQPS